MALIPICHTPTDGGIIGARHWAKQIVQKFPQQLLLQIQLNDTSHTVSRINKQAITDNIQTNKSCSDNSDVVITKPNIVLNTPKDPDWQDLQTIIH